MKSVIKLLAVVLIVLSVLFTYYKTVIQKSFLISNTEESAQQ